jgi:hypothetical protein
MRLEGGLLRKAAGILLIVFGAAAIGLSIVNMGGLITYQIGRHWSEPLRLDTLG